MFTFHIQRQFNHKNVTMPVKCHIIKLVSAAATHPDAYLPVQSTKLPSPIPVPHKYGR